MLAPVLLLWAIGDPFTHEKVKFVTTQPGPAGAATAFFAEFVITFILMLVLLVATNFARWKGAAGGFAAALIAIYIALESPLSGMSLNPARSFGSALTAGQWSGIWLYCLAPVASMLLAAETYAWMRRRRWIDRPEGQDASSSSCLVCDFKEGPRYPVEGKASGPESDTGPRQRQLNYAGGGYDNKSFYDHGVRGVRVSVGLHPTPRPRR